MKLSLFLLLWSPPALAEDEPEDSTSDETAAEGNEASDDTRPSGLPIRVPPKGAFAKEPTGDEAAVDPAAVDPTAADPTSEDPAPDERARPTGQPIRVPPSGAFDDDSAGAETAEEPDLDVPGLPAYLLPAVKAQAKEAADEPVAEDPLPETPAEPPAESVTAPPEQSDDDFLDDIERELQAEIEADDAAELPTVTVEDEVALVYELPPPPDPVTWEAYQAKRLRFTTYTPTGAFDRNPEWTIKTGAGRDMTAHQFARAVGDTATLDRLDADAIWGTRRGYVVAGAGGALILGSAVSLIGLDNTQSQYQQPLPQEGQFTEFGEYQEALAAATTSNDAQNDAAKSDRVWTAVGLATLGAITLTVAPRSKDAMTERQRSPANYYSRADADRWMNAYNGTVRQELGLPAFEGAVPAPSQRLEEADEAEDLDSELEELEREEAARRGDEPNGEDQAEPDEPDESDESESESDEPGHEPTPAPATPGKRMPELELQLAPGWFGLSGRF